MNASCGLRVKPLKKVAAFFLWRPPYIYYDLGSSRKNAVSN
ncbi:hypothetical protein QWZ13_04670 [Reinekea marina]|nr:hypothetical protein [Reinekea marina]MDN3648199.1 hypothetical protein [Reinekea marina]